MKLIYLFDDKIKPIIMKGKKYANPTNTQIINENLSCIREYDVNLWIYKKDKDIIVFDTGHLNYKNIDNEFKKIKINRKDIKNVFLTHIDVDHAGGIDKNGNNIFPDAQIYFGKKEEIYLNKKLYRFKRVGLKIYNCVEIDNGYKLLNDMQIIQVGNIKIQSIYVPGHTNGHICYLVDDKILITGDCLAINETGGYSFFDFFTQFPEKNKESLKKLKELVLSKDIELVCTGHSGFWKYSEKIFAHINESATFSKKKPFDQTAPNDLFN